MKIYVFHVTYNFLTYNDIIPIAFTDRLGPLPMVWIADPLRSQIHYFRFYYIQPSSVRSSLFLLKLFANTVLATLFSALRTRLAHSDRAPLINRITPSFAHNRFNCPFVLRSQTRQPRFHTSPYVFLNTFPSKIFNLSSSPAVVAQVLHDTTGPRYVVYRFSLTLTDNSLNRCDVEKQRPFSALRRFHHAHRSCY